MTKTHATTILVLGIILSLAQIIGIPLSWQEWISGLLGIFFIGLGVYLRHQFKEEKSQEIPMQREVIKEEVVIGVAPRQEIPKPDPVVEKEQEKVEEIVEEKVEVKEEIKPVAPKPKRKRTLRKIAVTSQDEHEENA